MTRLLPAFLLAVGAIASACASQSSTLPNGSAAPTWIATSSGLQYTVLDSGTGPIAQAGDEALIHETMHLMDGTLVFDSYAINSAVQFRVGGNQVIDGIDEAVTGMRVGGRRLLIVPPALSKRDVACKSADPEECAPPSKPLFTPEDSLRYDVFLVRLFKPATSDRDQSNR